MGNSLLEARIAFLALGKFGGFRIQQHSTQCQMEPVSYGLRQQFFGSQGGYWPAEVGIFYKK
jgi:hypothetical protein